jgi:hypothetical protein
MKKLKKKESENERFCVYGDESSEPTREGIPDQSSKCQLLKEGFVPCS